MEKREHSVLGKLIPDIGLKFAERCPIVHSSLGTLCMLYLNYYNHVA